MRDRICRRAFLLGGSSALFAETLPQRTRTKYPHERLRRGFVGIGNQSFGNLIRCQQEKVAALWDVDARYRGEAQSRFLQAPSFRDCREMLSANQLDAVVIGSPGPYLCAGQPDRDEAAGATTQVVTQRNGRQFPLRR